MRRVTFKIIITLLMLSAVFTGCRIESNVSSIYISNSNLFSSNDVSSHMDSNVSIGVSSMSDAFSEGISQGNSFEHQWPTQLGDIYLEMPIADFLEKYEKKIKSKSGEDYGDFYLTTYILNGLTVVFFNDSCHSVLTDISDYMTKDGLKVGDSREKVLSLYGEPTNKEENYWEYCQTSVEYDVFDIYFADGIVSKIFITMLD